MKPSERETDLQFRGWPIFMAVLWGLGLGFLFILTFMLTVTSGGDVLQAMVILGVLVGVVFLLLSVRFLRNEFVIRLLQTILFFVILLGGLMFPIDPDVFMAVPIAALCLIVFWALNQLNGTTLLLALCTMIVTCGLAGGVRVMYEIFGYHNTNYAFNHFFRIFTSCILFFPLFLLIFACVYMPRRVRFNRYFLPYRFRRYKPQRHNPQSVNEGFTLIEILIAVALLGITTAGMMKVWGNTIHSVYDTEQRAQVAAILSTEMNVLMTSDKLPPPGPVLHEFPVPIQDLYTKKNLTGAYLIASTSQERLIKIVVMVTQDIGGDAARHYRLESFRAIPQE